MKVNGHALITGGAGFIGSHLVERLLRSGERVVVLDDLSTGSLANLAAVQGHPSFTFIHAKVSECPELDRWVSEASAVYHLAAAVGVELVLHSPIRTLETNLHETECLLASAGKSGSPVLVASTSEVYGKSAKAAFSEEDDLLIGPPYLGRWSYACSKLMDEFLAMAYNRERKLPTVIVRLFNTVGPRQTGRYGMVLPRFIGAALKSQPLRVFGDGKQTRCFCFVLDAVEALVGLMNAPAAQGQIFNVGSDREISIRELAELVIQTLGSPSSVELLPYDQAYGPGFEDMLRRKPIIDKIRNLIGFSPTASLHDIIVRTAESLKSRSET